jgi:hypothetical protein
MQKVRSLLVLSALLAAAVLVSEARGLPMREWADWGRAERTSLDTGKDKGIAATPRRSLCPTGRQFDPRSNKCRVLIFTGIAD